MAVPHSAAWRGNGPVNKWVLALACNCKLDFVSQMMLPPPLTLRLAYIFVVVVAAFSFWQLMLLLLLQQQLLFMQNLHANILLVYVCGNCYCSAAGCGCCNSVTVMIALPILC